MAGYRITFDGSLNERKNLVQATGNSSLINTIVSQISPVNWDNVTTPWSNINYGSSGVWPDVFEEGWIVGSGTAGAPAASGGNSIVTLAAFESYAILTSSLPIGTVSWEFRYRMSSGSNGSINITRRGDSWSSRTRSQMSVGSINLGFIAPHPGSFTTYSGSTAITNTKQAIEFEITGDFGGNQTLEFDYIRFTSTSGGAITIFPATNIEGVAPIGGIATIASPSTIIDGQAALAGPAKLFGARVVHDSLEILDAKYLPPADVSEDAQLDAKNMKIITATATSISVEAEGLGSAERLEAGETSLIVEEHLGAVEN